MGELKLADVIGNAGSGAKFVRARQLAFCI